MKIGIVTPGGFDRSGTDRVIPTFLWLVERLAQHHEVHVFTLYQYPQPEEYQLLGATIHNVGYREGPNRNRFQIFPAIRAVIKEHKKQKFDILHGLWANQSGLVTVLAGKWCRIPTVITVAGGELAAVQEIGYGDGLRFRSRWKVELTLWLAGRLTSAAEYTRRKLITRYPDTRLIILGVDTEKFSPPAEPPQGPPWNLLHIASLNKVKDQPTLLRAFREIHNAEPSAHLDIVGEDTLGGEIQRLAGDLGIGCAVTFHGFQNSTVVARILQQAHLLIHSSLFEDAGPLVFLEAAACEVPTVGTMVGLIDDLAPHYCVSVPIGDYRTLASAAIALLRDDESRIDLGRRALAYARTHDADWTAAQFESIYLELTAKNSENQPAVAI